MMKVLVAEEERETYLYLNGLTVSDELALGPSIVLRPATWTASRDVVEPLCESQLDFAVASVFLPRVGSQLHISAPSGRELATLAWNSMWDAVLLSAFCSCDAVCNFQCNTSVEQVGVSSRLRITNYHLRGLADVHSISSDEAKWITSNFAAARSLLDEPMFQAAVHALASYRWHTMPRAQLALLWSAIEGLFQIESEVVFRLSLYVARFLWPTSDHERRATFAHVKTMYKTRSVAVHGGELKHGASGIVSDSAQLLRSLVRQCVELGSVPRVKDLAP